MIDWDAIGVDVTGTRARWGLVSVPPLRTYVARISRRERLLAQLDTVRWEDLPTERLEAVWALVTGATP